METDYSTLTEKDFENTIKNIWSFYIMNGSIDEKELKNCFILNMVIVYLYKIVSP
ncbi:hypothetical protein OFR29_09330 [Brachyspira hyodysenteriae]|nr:hypothetical protein [Brachyspira hyodysenteriae]MCZ9892480.1 hypothetical protein [Brachyspira hyodysenteriae]MCZ9990025.1 hypothetical protein [Brachyspira hyodysenteriae]MCZ9998393.1 hypothetical protein [Brachyspira hyodysenteriae]MCZ9999609.1 hypothetical protein [Brachyspira hyodysenteriae]MDA0029667.1 hypothetical protein [Brachyspira hyodysenteriae]